MADEGVWWTENQLDAGTYHYKFLVDGVEIADPYARRLPADATPQVVVGAPAYEWGDSGWDRPSFNNLVIFALHIGNFAAPFNFASVAAKLPYLRDLGINAVELMSVAGFGGKPGWGYDPRFFLAPEQTCGSPEELKALIDQAHQYGIAVILDVVFAPTATDHSLNHMYDYSSSPWYGDNDLAEPNQFGLPRLDHKKAATKAFLKDVQDH